jgi:hypothetical protein
VKPKEIGGNQGGVTMAKHLKLAAVAAAVLLLVTAFTAPASAVLNAHRTTYLTFSRPVALPGIELGAGSYIFELVSPENTLNIVRVMSRDRKQVHLTAFTLRVERPRSLKDGQVITLGEARRGEAPPITGWYPLGESTGNEFIYRR